MFCLNLCSDFCILGTLFYSTTGCLPEVGNMHSITILQLIITGKFQLSVSDITDIASTGTGGSVLCFCSIWCDRANFKKGPVNCHQRLVSFSITEHIYLNACKLRHSQTIICAAGLVTHSLYPPICCCPNGMKNNHVLSKCTPHSAGTYNFDSHYHSQRWFGQQSNIRKLSPRKMAFKILSERTKYDYKCHKITLFIGTAELSFICQLNIGRLGSWFPAFQNLKNWECPQSKALAKRPTVIGKKANGYLLLPSRNNSDVIIMALW